MGKVDRPPTPTSDVPRLSPRPDTTHKAQVGRIAIVAGSRGMSGAVCLSGLGALRGGAGLVRACCPESILPIVAASEPCLMTMPLAEDPEGRISPAALPALLESLKWADVTAIGPGLGLGDGVANVVRTILRDYSGPAVVDADALNNLAEQPQWWLSRHGRPTVITPHPGEIARLRRGTGLDTDPEQTEEARLATAFEFATLTGTTVVLKGHRTVVCTSDEAYINTTGNPGMATGGMGDVLTGLIAALVGQGLSAFDAARLGVYAHGAAADECAKRIAPVGYLAREVADGLPPALARASQPTVGFMR
jgi:ADP-dependent NAD(P)H-hydrate dehydratase